MKQSKFPNRLMNEGEDENEENLDNPLPECTLGFTHGIGNEVCLVSKGSLLLKKDLFKYHSFPRPFVVLPLRTAGFGTLFFIVAAILVLLCSELEIKIFLATSSRLFNCFGIENIM